MATSYPGKRGFVSLSKTDEVIELLQNLPYIDSRREDWQVMPWSEPCDYVNKAPQEYRALVPDGFEFPPRVIRIIFSGRYGRSLMLDTSDGMNSP